MRTRRVPGLTTAEKETVAVLLRVCLEAKGNVYPFGLDSFNELEDHDWERVKAALNKLETPEF